MLVRALNEGWAMKRVTLDLENCYGIKKLKHVFEFAKVRAYALYAPNGVMKSSLAQTFQDVATAEESRDRIFQGRTTKRSITDETGSELSADQVLVVGPYNEQLGPNERTSTLLVDAKLRAEYANLRFEIQEATDALLASVKKQAKSRKDFETEISTAFTPGRDLQTALMSQSSTCPTTH